MRLPALLLLLAATGCELGTTLLYPIAPADGDADADADTDADVDTDADADADADAGPDAGVDAGVDAGADAGPPECAGSQTTPCGESDIGECTLGAMTCTDGHWGPCVGAVNPDEERCNGRDEDCDGVTDTSDPDAQTTCGGGQSCVQFTDFIACYFEAACGDNWQTCCDDSPCAGAPGYQCAAVYADCTLCEPDGWGCDCFVCYLPG